MVVSFIPQFAHQFFIIFFSLINSQSNRWNILSSANIFGCISITRSVHIFLPLLYLTCDETHTIVEIHRNHIYKFQVQSTKLKIIFRKLKSKWKNFHLELLITPIRTIRHALQTIFQRNFSPFKFEYDYDSESEIRIIAINISVGSSPRRRRNNFWFFFLFFFIFLRFTRRTHTFLKWHGCLITKPMMSVLLNFSGSTSLLHIGSDFS